MAKFFAFIFLTMATTAYSYAQTALRIEGHIYDIAGVPIPGVTLTISALGNAAKKQITISDSSGFFVVSKFSREKFLVQAKHVGFTEYATEYHYLPENNKLVLNDIILQPAVQILQEVVVKNTIPAITIKEDTIEYKADSFHVRPDDDVEVLLKKLPGLKVEKDGSIIAHGQVVKKIKVNGKEFFGGDVQTVTKNLPADIVDKVQVIDDYGETANFTGFKTGSSDKIINIQLKKDKNQGYFGKAELAYGTTGRYAGKINFNRFSNQHQTALFLNANNISSGSFYSNISNYGSLSQLSRATNNAFDQLGGVNNVISIVNNKDIGFVTANSTAAPGINKNFTTGLNHSYEAGKLKVYGSILHHHINNTRVNNVAGLQFFDTTIINNTSTGNTNNTSSGERVFLNAEYTIDTFSVLQAMQTFTTNKTIAAANNSIALYELADTLNYTNQKNNTDTRLRQSGTNILLKRKFRKYGRSLLLNFSVDNSKTSDNNTQLTNDLISGTYISNQKNEVEDTKTQWSSGINYTEAVLKHFLLNMYAGIQHQQDNNRSQLYAFDAAQSKYLLNPANSGSFISSSRLYNYGFDIKNKQGRFVSTAGVGWQSVSFEREKDGKNIDKFTQSSFAPRASVNYIHSKTLSVLLKYAAFYNSPTSKQLSPITDTLNPLAVYKGNPNLKAEFIHKIDLVCNNVSPVKGNVVVVAAGYQNAANKIVQDVSIDALGRQLITYQNAKNFSSVDVFFNISKPILNKLIEFTVGGNYNYKKAYYSTKGQLISLNNYTANQFTQITYNPADWVEINFGKEISFNRYATSGSTFKSSTNSWFAGVLLNGDKYKLNLEGKRTIFNHYLINSFSSAIIVNASLEKSIGKHLLAKATLTDLFNNTNNNVIRRFNSNSFSDYNTNALGRFFTMGIAWRISKLKGLQQQKTINTDNQIR